MKRKVERWYRSELHAEIDALYDEAARVWPGDRTWRDFAENAGLAYETVRRLGLRITRFPEARTIMALRRAIRGQRRSKAA